MNPSSTGFNPGVLDDTKAAGDTFLLELWVDATDTNVNGVEATIQYDGTQLELLESASASDSFFGSAGIASDEVHNAFGDVLANTGVFSGAAGNTATYAVLTNPDSASADTVLVRFLFQVRSTATSYSTTSILFKTTATETTVVTAADSNATNVLTGTDTGLIFITAGQDTHAVLTLVSPGYTGASAFEFVSIFNPTDQTLDLSKYHLSDDDSGYITATQATPAAASGDFIVRFPNGATLAPGETATVALSSSDVHAIVPGLKIDYEIEQDGNGDGIPDMVILDTTGSVGLTNGGEAVILFYWDGAGDLVEDVDILVWGTGNTPNKTGKSIDGIDGDAVVSNYLGDSATMTKPSAPAAGSVLRRASFLQGDTGTNERTSGGNGLTGHDETSESASVSWAASSDSLPWHTMAIVAKRGDYAAAIAEADETGVEGLSLWVRGRRGAADSIVEITLRTLGTADTANIDTVSVWVDANGDSLIDGGDTFAGDFAILSATSWRFTGSIFVPASGAGLLIGFQVGDTVQNGETVLFTIDTATIDFAVADSASFLTLSNANAVTLVAGVLKVTKLADVAATTIRPADTATVMAVRITGAAGADTLTSFALDTLGALDDTDVSVRMWRDADQSFTYNAGDVLVAELFWNAAAGWWDTTGAAIPLAAGGDTFVFTITTTDTAGSEGDSFVATVPASSADAANAETGPALAVTNANAVTFANAVGIANHVVIAAVYPDAIAVDGSGEWILLYNPTDTAVNLQNWKIGNASSNPDATLTDTTIPARGWYLIADAGFVKDNPLWPDADHSEAITLNNSNFGVTLFDSTGAAVDRFGYGSEATHREGTGFANPTTNAGDIFVRKAHALTSAKEAILSGGRDEVGGAGYDSFDNSADFIEITGTDSAIWTLRSRNSAPETPARKTTVVRIYDTMPSATESQGDTGITLMSFFLQGDTSASATLAAFRVDATDTMQDTNLAAVYLYEDANGNARFESGDIYVATLIATGNATWETTGLSYAWNGLTGETFLVVVDLAATVTNGETFQPMISLRTVGTSNADSGPTLIRTNAGILTLQAINPIVITKNASITAETVAPTADTRTVIAFRARGNGAGDSITKFTLENAGTLTTADIAQVRLWQDADGDSLYSAGDTLVSALVATAANRWEDTTLNVSLGAGGADFVVTIDLGTATDGETFSARIPANGSDAALFDTGPSAAVTEANLITVSTAAGVTMLLTEVDLVTGTDFVEVLVVDDGNGGGGVNVRNWILRDNASGSDRKILGDTDNNGVSDTDVIVVTGDRLVFQDAAGTDESSSGGDGVLNFFNTGLVFTSTEDNVELYDSTGTGRDAVVWSNRDGTPTAGFESDFAAVIAKGLWAGGAGNNDTTHTNTVTPRSGTSFTSGYSLQRGGTTDRDTYLDWGEAARTQGSANAMENPPTPPARLSGITLADVPDDLGGVLEVVWTPDTSIADFLEYRVYLESQPLDSLLDTTILPRTTVANSTTVSATVSGLTNGESYYAVVTAVDSYGLEFRFALSGTGPVAPVLNITDTPQLRINEVFTQGNGVTDTDYVEIFVAYDGNPSGNLNLSGWKIEAHSGLSKTLGSVTVGTGDYLLLRYFTSPPADDADSTGDNVADLYQSSAGITSTDAYVRLLDSQNRLIDFVVVSNRDGTFTGAVQTAVRAAIDSGGWTGDSVENAAVNPASLGGFVAADVVARDGVSSDSNNSRDDWSVTTARSPGAANVGVENPITVPDSRPVTLFRDVPNDFGGAVEIAWDTSGATSDFVRYNIYLETVAIGVRIDTSRFTPRATITDSTLATTTVSGLANGESLYCVVTVTDSWGHERRTGLIETGPVAPSIQITGVPRIRITEVKFAGTTDEFIELLVIDDGNPSGPLNIAGFKLTKDDTVTPDIVTLGSLTIADSEYVVLHNIVGTTESDSGGDSVAHVYNLTFSLAEGDENLFLIQAGGDTILDFVNWSTRDGNPTASEAAHIQYAIDQGAWAAQGTQQQNARNPAAQVNDFNDSSSITRDLLATDSNSDTDWMIDPTPTPGAPTAITEQPPVAPAAVPAIQAADVAGDFGGAILVSWTAVADPLLSHYNVYRETSAIAASLYGTNLEPRDTTAAGDTDYIATGLANGETYWFSVTAVDSHGNERKVSLATDSAVPVANVAGESVLITEVSFKESAAGVLGYDWIELKVAADGVSAGNLDMLSWIIQTRDGSKVLGSAIVGDGDRILLHYTTGVDEADSMSGNGDGILDLYAGAGGLTGTDNHVTLFRSDGDTEDFVSWVDAGGYIASESTVVAAAIASGHWTDFAPAGVGEEDGVNSDSVSANWSIVRAAPDTGDANSKSDWTLDSSPTPGLRNDTATLWRITGTLDLLGRANDTGVPVTAGNASETYLVQSVNGGTYVLRVPDGTWNLTADTQHYLRRVVTGVVVSGASLSGQNVGSMYPGDANDDNLINIFDAAATKFAVDTQSGNGAADHVDALGTLDNADLQAVRDNFGRTGD